MEELKTKIEAGIAGLDPEIELIALEQPAGGVLRLYIDHPDGVGLELCERVSKRLGGLLDDRGLEVSSPGDDRPLTRPEHFKRFLGRRIRVRTTEPIGSAANFTGELTLAEGAEVSIRIDGRDVIIPHRLISRSNLVPQPPIPSPSEVQS